MTCQRARRALRNRVRGLTWATGLSLTACTAVDDPTLKVASDPRFAEPSSKQTVRPHDPLRHVFWGDLHIHTSHSYDAYTFGVRATPDDAYRYAQGETIEHAIGYPIRALRPLDFAAVTAHAEYLGAARRRAERAETLGDPPPSLGDIVATGNRFYITYHFLKTTLTQMGSTDRREATFGQESKAASGEAWEDIRSAAERHNDPGRFTTFIGYEWSSMPNEENLHRNVIYRSALAPALPFSARDSEDPEDLWQALEEQRELGMEMIAIPHNANVSNGRMYERTRFDGSPIDEAYSAARMKNEPISEILQVKGQSETHPNLSSKDEFADFEIYDEVMSTDGRPSQPQGSYAREALKTGIELSATHGWNPFQFGFIGSSDSHNASSAVEEDNFHGKLPMLDGTAGLRLGESTWLPKSQIRSLKWGAAGLAAVWAEENTRASIFDGLRRKETYATSGPRIAVRLFGGWQYPADLTQAPDFLSDAYANGVPMGGTLPGAPGSVSPRFAVWAIKDPQGANLDRIQIIKGWVDSTGQSHERIYDVAASDARLPGDGVHPIPPVGNTVDLETARYSNSIGATELQVVWEDPHFDPAQEAFWYARVLEIPTPRWSTYDAVALGVTPPEPSTIQERAITSAIGYSPPASTSNHVKIP